jgi:hypothetical protein
MTTRNLLSETEERLDMLGLTPNDVWWVGSDSGVYWTTWQGFKELAKDVNYEPDCYRPQIPTDLIIMLEANKGCLARRILGGGNGEWWDFHHWPEKHMFGHKEIVRLYDPHFHDDMETYCE